MRPTVLACGLALSFGIQVHAEEFPHKPITMIVPFGAGGTTDVAARLVAQQLALVLSNPVVVENKPGASTMIAADYVARAPKDGYTLLMAAASTLATNPHLYSKIGYKLADFAPVSMVTKVPFVLNVSSHVPVKSIDEFVTWARAQPQGVSYGTTGVGTSNHITGIVVAQALGVKMVDVPYKGNAAANVDLIAGQTHAQLDALAGALPLHVDGKTRILGVLDTERWPGLPNIPTFVEKGYQAVGYSWFALMAPAGTPPAVVRKLADATARVLAMEEVKAKFLAGGQLPFTLDPEATGRFIQTDQDRWGAVIRKAGIRLD